MSLFYITSTILWQCDDVIGGSPLSLPSLTRRDERFKAAHGNGWDVRCELHRRGSLALQR